MYMVHKPRPNHVALNYICLDTTIVELPFVYTDVYDTMKHVKNLQGRENSLKLL